MIPSLLSLVQGSDELPNNMVENAFVAFKMVASSQSRLALN